MNRVFAWLAGVFVVFLIVAAAFVLTAKRDDPPLLQAFINGVVLTVDKDDSKQEALLIEQDSILAVGTTQEIVDLIQQHPDRGEVIVHDLAGKAVVPGFIDAHSHFPGSGVYEFALDLNAPPIGAIKNIQQIQEQLRSRIQSMEEVGWVFGLGYDDSQMSDNRHPFRQELDAVSSSIPIFLLHISGHMGVANSKAFEMLGIDSSTVAPEGGEYQKTDDGQLTGLILETAVFDFLNASTDYSITDTLRIVRRASAEYLQQGVTSVQNGAADQRYITGLNLASRFDVVPQRVVVWPVHEALPINEVVEARRDPGDYYQIGAVKIIADGSIQGYTGYLREPYHKPVPGKPKSYRGKAVIESSQLVDLVSEYFAVKQPLAIHGNGDASIDEILHAVEVGLDRHPWEDHRTVLIHAQMAQADQLEKMRDLGVTPSFFSAHTYYWGDRHWQTFMGPQRARRMSPANSARRLGIPFSIHLDTPVVPMNSMRLMWTAVERKSAQGRSIGRAERLTREQALRAMTMGPAFQIFKDESLGSIEVGKKADLVILDQDPTNRSNQILETQVLETFVGGLSVFRKNEE